MANDGFDVATTWQRICTCHPSRCRDWPIEGNCRDARSVGNGCLPGRSHH